MTGSSVSNLTALLCPELLMGIVCSVSASTVGFNVSEAGRGSASQFVGARYGRGEVGEFVLIEGQTNLILGRVSDVKVSDGERRSLKLDYTGRSELDVVGQIQLLGTVAMDSIRAIAGVATYPRLGDRIYAAPNWYLARLPQLLGESGRVEDKVILNLGFVGRDNANIISITPERLFGRHCGILGTTGGGKSWTTARIVEECIRFDSKVILVDATGEYRGFGGKGELHFHLGEPIEKAVRSTECGLPPTSFVESDFVALFEPAGKVQGPKFRAAIRSLRLAARCKSPAASIFS